MSTKKSEKPEDKNSEKDLNKSSSKQEEIVFKNSKSKKKKSINPPAELKKQGVIETKEKKVKEQENKQEKNQVETQDTKQENKKVNNQNGNIKKDNITDKDNKNTSKKEETKKADNKSEKKKKEVIEEKKPEEKKQELIKSNEEKQKNKKKILIISIITVILLAIALVFSTVFALIHATKNVIARGVSIENIDISNLTYNEAKAKLEKAFNVGLEVNMDFNYGEFSHRITSEDIGLEYELTSYLEQAYNIGRSGNIIQNNYELIFTSLLNKNIDANYKYNEEAVDTVIEYISTNVPNLVKQYSYNIDGDSLIILPGTDGVIVEKEKLKSAIISNIQNRNLTELLKEVKDAKIDIPCKEVVAEKIDIEKIYNEVKREPQNAYYVDETETTNFEIHADVDGIDFAISLEEAKNIISEEGKTEYRIPLKISKAEITIKDIGIEAFPYLVGESQSVYDASNTNRSENLKIASNKISGTVLLPGEQFSFNKVVGERTVSEGYKDAAIYSDGQVVNGLAGGICQISSTLYNAVLDANLQIDERHNHSFTTSYYRAGRDATVVYGVKDFKFTNTRTYPIKIEASVSNGVAKFFIYGIKEENEYEVKIIPVTTETRPFTTQTIVDYTMAPGTSRVTQGGASGCKVTTYKEVYLNGVQISREVISNDVYQVMTRIVKVGPTPTAPVSAPEATPSEPSSPEVPQPEQPSENPTE